MGPAAVVLVLGVLIVVTERAHRATFAHVQESHELQLTVERLLGAVRDAEAGQRGYLLTGESAYAELMARSRTGADTLLARVRVDARRADQRLHVQRLSRLVDHRLARLDTGAALRRSGDLAAAYAFVGLPAGRLVMDSLRAEAAAFERTEQARATRLDRQDDAYERRLRLALYLGTPIAVLLALLGGGLLARAERAQLALAQRALRENDERRTAESKVRVAATRARVLADAGSALGDEIDADQAIEVAAQAAVPALADLCVVDLVELDGRPRRAGVAHVDPEVAQLVRESSTRGSRGAGLPPEQATREGQRVFLPDVAPGTLETAAGDTPQRLAIAATRPRSLITVPLRSQGHVIGALTLIRSEGREPAFDEGDLATAEELARRTAAAVATARAYRVALAARAEAEQANRAKSTFLATMSHELRTPLNAVLGYVDLLDAEIAGPLSTGQRDYVARVRTSGQHLLGLIAEILDLAKVEAGQMRVRADRQRVGPVVMAALELVRPLADTRRIALADRCVTPAEFQGDEDRVRQILVNLLSNALKFTEPGGAVTVTCDAAVLVPDRKAQLVGRGPWLRVAVQDTGIGIPPEKAESIFAPFVQLDAGHTREVGGTGLGLSISRSFARLMEGDLTVESEPGVGSTFALWLPMPTDEATRIERLVTTGEWRAPMPERRIEVGRALASRAAEVVRHVTERLRDDPMIPNGRTTAQADLEDHLVGYVADLGQSLTIVDAPSGADRAGLARDADALQDAFVRRHGAQRARLGWDEQAIRREFVIVAEEIERAVRRSFGRELDAMADDVLPLLRALLDTSLVRAIDGWGAALPRDGAGR